MQKKDCFKLLFFYSVLFEGFLFNFFWPCFIYIFNWPANERRAESGQVEFLLEYFDISCLFWFNDSLEFAGRIVDEFLPKSSNDWMSIFEHKLLLYSYTYYYYFFQYTVQFILLFLKEIKHTGCCFCFYLRLFLKYIYNFFFKFVSIIDFFFLWNGQIFVRTASKIVWFYTICFYFLFIGAARRDGFLIWFLLASHDWFIFVFSFILLLFLFFFELPLL